MILLEKRNLFDEAYETFRPAAWDQVADMKIIDELRQGMIEAVRRKDGTAARLSEARISVAAKTGTAGKREGGYDAILMGYFPTEMPEIAFGMIIEGGGLAGVEGARVLNNFLDFWYRRGGGVDEVRLERTR